MACAGAPQASALRGRIAQRNACAAAAASRRPARLAVQARAGGEGRRPAAPLRGLAAAAAAAALLAAPAALASDAAATFERSCAGCHTGGGNIIRRDATLQLGDLQKYGVADSQALYTLIYSGKGSMPGFGQECAPRGQCTFGPRLPDEEIRELAEFVLASAEAGWPQ